MDPVSAALPQNFRRFFVATLVEGASADMVTQEDKEIDMSKEARIIIEAVQILNEAKGLSAVIAMIRGEKGCKSLYEKHQQHPSFGCGKSKPKQFWTALIREMISQGEIHNLYNTWH